jgi:hypothetical protein
MHFRILLLYCIFQREIKSVLPFWIMLDPVFVDQMCGSYLVAQLWATDTFLTAGINAQMLFFTKTITKQDLHYFWWVHSWKWHLDTWIQVVSWKPHQRKHGQWEVLADQKMNVQIQAISGTSSRRPKLPCLRSLVQTRKAWIWSFLNTSFLIIPLI